MGDSELQLLQQMLSIRTAQPLRPGIPPGPLPGRHHDVHGVSFLPGWGEQRHWNRRGRAQDHRAAGTYRHGSGRSSRQDRRRPNLWQGLGGRQGSHGLLHRLNPARDAGAQRTGEEDRDCRRRGGRGGHLSRGPASPFRPRSTRLLRDRGTQRLERRDPGIQGPTAGGLSTAGSAQSHGRSGAIGLRAGG